MSQKASCSKQDWIRLQSLINAVSSSQSRLAEYENRIPEVLDENVELQNHLSKVQNKQLYIRIGKKELERIRKRIRNIQHRLTISFEEECQQGDRRLELERVSNNTISQIELTLKENQILRSNLIILKNELIYRRRFMLDGLYKIYFIDNYLIRHFKRTCSCTKFDVIAGLHLPLAFEKADHSDFELCGAISHLVNLLNCTSRIVDFPLKNPLSFRGSHSLISSRLSVERFDFYLTLTKVQKARFDLCQRLLCDNVVQFRSDCNLPTQLELPIASIREALLYCIGRYTIAFPREPTSTNFYCCASLIPPNPLPSNNLNLSSLNGLQISDEKQPDKNQSECLSIAKSSILEVISTN